jgi:hypothetical protein
MKLESISAWAVCCSLAACGEPDRTPDPPLPQTVASNVAGPATSIGTGGFSTTGISESNHTTAGFVPAGGTAGVGGAAVGSGGLPNIPSRQQHEEPAGRGMSLELRYALFR